MTPLHNTEIQDVSSLSAIRPLAAALWWVLAVCSMSACTIVRPVTHRNHVADRMDVEPRTPPAPVEKELNPCRSQQHEIERLKLLVAEKDTIIRNQQLQREEQTKTLQEATSQVTIAQSKLRRLATKPAVASAIAETEIAMKNLKSVKTDPLWSSLRTQAQRFLDAATVAYTVENLSVAMDHAARSKELIDILDAYRLQQASPGKRNTAMIPLQTTIPLQLTADSRLFQEPRSNAPVTGILKKGFKLTTHSWQGGWLRVQTKNGSSGWVPGSVVEAYIATP